MEEQVQQNGLLNSLLGEYQTEVVHTVNIPVSTAIIAVILMLSYFALGALFKAFKK